VWAWKAAAVAFVVFGSLLSLVFALGVAARARDDSRDRFHSTATAVASTLQLTLQHEADLAADAAAFVVGNPGVTNGEFRAWVSAAQVTTRYPELAGVAEMVIVPAAALPDYEKRLAADPLSNLSPGGRFAVVPSGQRPFYCFVPVAKVIDPTVTLPADFDVCSTAAGSFVATARDSSHSAYFPYPAGNQTLLAVETPFYSGGSIPVTLTSRRAAFIGLIGTVIDPNVVLSRALQGHPGDRLALAHRLGASTVTFGASSKHHGHPSATIELENGWTATMSGLAAPAGLLTDGVALAVFVAGLLMTVLLGVLMYVLATGRARARQLVAVKTEELRYQVLHDSLTGLPNRTLILDRVEQALVRARRYNTPLAVMFLDLDDFKDVNDTFGHAVGDQLLCAVSARLIGILRSSDTVGRLGGDEFVVVVDGQSLDAGPEVIAERIREALAPPFVLPGAASAVVHAQTSIGIAVGVQCSSDELLRDADIALYEAKAAGKGCYAVFAPRLRTVS
jgi:diguanylate cyclase (GGDEF)-like protein